MYYVDSSRAVAVGSFEVDGLAWLGGTWGDVEQALRRAAGVVGVGQGLGGVLAGDVACGGWLGRWTAGGEESGPGWAGFRVFWGRAAANLGGGVAELVLEIRF